MKDDDVITLIIMLVIFVLVLALFGGLIVLGVKLARRYAGGNVDETNPAATATTIHTNYAKKSRSAFVKRYVDLYRAAKLLRTLGTAIKIAGAVFAVLIFLFWFIVGVIALAQTPSTSPLDPNRATQSTVNMVMFFVSLVIGFGFGALVGGVFFLLGVLISAQGQLLMAHADSAVHTSPFLTDEERANAMSLPYSAPTISPARAG